MSAGGMPVSINLETQSTPMGRKRSDNRCAVNRRCVPRAHGMRNVIIAGVGLLLAGAVAVVVLFFAGRSGISAQGTAAPPTAVAQGQQPAGPVRTETITYDMWTVACRDTPEGGTRKACSARLTIQAQQQNQRITVGNWIIGRNTEGGLVSVVVPRSSTSASSSQAASKLSWGMASRARSISSPAIQGFGIDHANGRCNHQGNDCGCRWRGHNFVPEGRWGRGHHQPWFDQRASIRPSPRFSERGGVAGSPTHRENGPGTGRSRAHAPHKIA